MIILDVHLSPGPAVWITSTFNLECYSAIYLDLQFAKDKDIFAYACSRNAIVIITKDDDFVTLLTRNGSPPKVIWLTCGNTSNERLKEIFTQNLPQALQLLQTSDLVEIAGQ